ncbi:MAG: PilN domain-containing protein [Nitrospinales bacterium]
MALIKINLYDFQEEVRRIQIQKQLVVAGSIVVVALVLIGFVALSEKQKNFQVSNEIAKLDSQISVLESRYRVIKKMQKKTKRINQIIVGIENLRNNQSQPARFLNDLNQLLPDAIWLKRIDFITKRDAKKSGVNFNFEGGLDEIIEIKGMTIQPKAVTQYVERLKKLPYFKTIHLWGLERKRVGINQAWLFYIYCHRI